MVNKNFKKVVSTFIAIVLLIQTIPFASANGSTSGVISILHTNDMHGRFKQDDKVLGLDTIKSIKDATPNSILVDAGDTIHGLPFVTLDKGVTALDLLEVAGYEFMVPGNHDFNYGYEHLLEIFKNAKNKGMKLNLLSANTTKDDKLLFEQNIVKELTVNGKTIKVGFFGLTTQETAYKTNPNNVKNIVFQNPIQVAQKEVKALKDKNADIIIAIGHIGVDESSSPTSIDIIKAVDGIDVFIDGHSHTTFKNGEKINNTMLVSTGEYASNIGKVDISIDANNKITSVNASLITKEDAKDVKPDATIKNMIKDIDIIQEKELSVVVGKTNTDLDGIRDNVRNGETNLGNLITDSMLDETGADIALTNGGGIRASIPKGNITKGDIVKVLPFGNYIVTKKITGAQLKEVLEHGVSNYGTSFGGFPHIGGMSFAVDQNLPIGNRITDITIKNKPFDINQTYILATNDFTAVGGDSYPVLADLPILNEYKALNESLESYITKLSTVDYSKQGRISATAKDLIDISNHWGVDSIKTFISKGFVNGYEDNTFKPENNITRAEFIKLVNSVYNLTETKDEDFSDVSSNDWFYNDVKKAISAGYIKGYSDKTFKPNEPITREEASVIVAKVANLKSTKSTNFADNNKISIWASESVNALTERGIIKGYNDNTFKPSNKLTRVESLVMLERAS